MVVDGFFVVVYFGTLLISFPVTIYACDTLKLLPFLRITASIENVSLKVKVLNVEYMHGCALSWAHEGAFNSE